MQEALRSLLLVIWEWIDMKKDIAWYTNINVDIFRASILIIVCNDWNKLKNTATFLDKKFKTKGTTMQAINVAMNFDYLYSQTIQLDNASGDIIVIFNYDASNNVSYETMVHEFHHASHYLCKSRGIDDEETETYLQEHLFNNMLCEIDKYIENNKNKSKRTTKKTTKEIVKA
jgi:hypothetical protein